MLSIALPNFSNPFRSADALGRSADCAQHPAWARLWLSIILATSRHSDAHIPRPSHTRQGFLSGLCIRSIRTSPRPDRPIEVHLYAEVGPPGLFAGNCRVLDFREKFRLFQKAFLGVRHGHRYRVAGAGRCRPAPFAFPSCGLRREPAASCPRSRLDDSATIERHSRRSATPRLVIHLGADSSSLPAVVPTRSAISFVLSCPALRRTQSTILLASTCTSGGYRWDDHPVRGMHSAPNWTPCDRAKAPCETLRRQSTRASGSISRETMPCTPRRK